MRIVGAWRILGGLLALLALAGGLAACDAGGPSPTATPPPPPTSTPDLHPAPRPEVITFKEGLAKILPEARDWNSAALLERCNSLPLDDTFRATIWSCIFVTPDGQQRQTIAVSSSEFRQPNTTGTLAGTALTEVQQHAPLVAQLLDSPALLTKLDAQQIAVSKATHTLTYYMAGDEAGLPGQPHPLVQLQGPKNEPVIILDAITGQVLKQ